ncbi:methylenetetrahydrofolate--tRNA-(uracil(54)-C(5))-methyltransferase (FADH(2)-oxidizing) TrmFO [Desulfopila sp. IMCC35008]|uniref:methylenetetrahydrofolate--tRNA-(uracil(54)- C(5))-methyltransferase (FADH(2)-oxidizing) TrmFO n=1 Tax=Desulfopila sp. IMCC35008 TaxID=2653858 RepID=UPI0013D48CE0|nr:methylenetetrahydrofolate--tRNA-(uracil(54)-C(5))-methyltransferase (FADH(2)-oxidizing) TrmFO [Desulfopila sp. IMCC35008]
MTITIIGGGLAGCEAAWQALRKGCKVVLYDMKPVSFSPAHNSENLAELVCSNSFRSDDAESAVGLLKEEMRRCDSLIMNVAEKCKVPAGKALAVDRELFAREITSILHDHPDIEIVREEISTIPEPGKDPIILATGPLTSEKLTDSLIKLTGRERLAFYDAIAPIVDVESLNMDVVYSKSRYDDGPGDYLNCPFDKEKYLAFINELEKAEYVPLKDFEKPKYFEGCLPIEVINSRGEDTLRFGPMKPVGLPDPRTGKDPYAVVQLRQENKEKLTYNMVGFQTKLTYKEQQRIFRMIPGMENAVFVRYGSIHRNTFICSPELLLPTLEFRKRNDLILAGQLSGVEGYVESAAMGLLAGINSVRKINGLPATVPPAETALGALVRHLTESDPARFQPSNVNFGLFPPWEKKVPKRLRGQKRKEAGLAALQIWMEQAGL